MNDHEIQRIAAAMHAARPDWPASSVATLIRKNLADRPRRDVFVALAWVASEPGTSTPARVLETGPWWRAAGVEGTTSKRNPFDPGGNCSTCSLEEDQCRRVWSGDHDYISVAAYAKTVNRDPERIRRIVEAAKGEVTPTRTPAAPKEASVAQRDHSECEEAITAAAARGRTGEAEYLAERCDRLHGSAVDELRDIKASAMGVTESMEEMA